MSEKSTWTDCGAGWSVNLLQELAEHESGFRLAFSGHPSSRNFDIQPSGVPENMQALEWARLLRQGTDSYRRAFGKEGYSDGDLERTSAPAKQAKAPVITVKRRRQIG